MCEVDCKGNGCYGVQFICDSSVSSCSVVCNASASLCPQINSFDSDLNEYSVDKSEYFDASYISNEIESRCDNLSISIACDDYLGCEDMEIINETYKFESDASFSLESKDTLCCRADYSCHVATLITVWFLFSCFFLFLFFLCVCFVLMCCFLFFAREIYGIWLVLGKKAVAGLLIFLQTWNPTIQFLVLTFIVAVFKAAGFLASLMLILYIARVNTVVNMQQFRTAMYC